MHGSRSKIPSKKSRQAALRGGNPKVCKSSQQTFSYFQFICSLFNNSVRNSELHNGEYMTLNNELEIMLKFALVTNLRQDFCSCQE
jgi:hypothetical protein